MGINSITCKGAYEETGKTGFGEGTKSASDFDGNDLTRLILLTLPVTLFSGMVYLATTLPREKTYLFDKNYSEPEKHATSDAPQVTQSRYTEFSFNKRGETGLVHDEFTNSSYRIDFDRIHGGLFGHVAHLNITDVNTSETKSLAIRNSALIDIDMRHSASIDVGSKYANITIKETEALNK